MRPASPQQSAVQHAPETGSGSCCMNCPPSVKCGRMPPMVSNARMWLFTIRAGTGPLNSIIRFNICFRSFPSGCGTGKTPILHSTRATRREEQEGRETRNMRTSQVQVLNMFSCAMAKVQDPLSERVVIKRTAVARGEVMNMTNAKKTLEAAANSRVNS